MHSKKTKLSQRFQVDRNKHIRRLKKIRRHPAFTIPALTFGGLLLLTAAAFLVFTKGSARIKPSDSRIVIISHDHVEQTVPTHEPTVGALLNKLNIKVNPGDVVEPSASSPINQDDFRVNIYRGVPVEIVDGEHRTFTYSAASTPRSIVKQAGVNAFAEDNLNLLPTDNFLTEDAIGQRVVIDRATPVNLNLYGTQIQTRTHAKTVGDLLKEKNIKLAKGDSVNPAVTTPVSSDQSVFIVRNGTKLLTVEQDIPMPTQTVEDSSLTVGTTAVRQQGSPGKQVLTYQINLKNGIEVGRTQIQSVTTQQPVTQIVAQGTNLSGIKGDMALAGISPGDYQYADYIISHESGWCPTKAQGQYGGCPAYAGSVPAYGGYGLCQSTPGSKMSSAGADWATNPVTQLKWCSSYAARTYGGWAAAYNHWLSSHNW
jgi:uncharacterized protein YabE (DUF348 family)